MDFPPLSQRCTHKSGNSASLWLKTKIPGLNGSPVRLSALELERSGRKLTSKPTPQRVTLGLRIQVLVAKLLRKCR